MDSRQEESRPASSRLVLLTMLLTSLFWLVVGGLLLFTWRQPSPLAIEIQPPPATATPPPPTPTATPAPLLIDVAGAVRFPGLYELPPGSRVQQALDAAGGTAHNADLGPLSLARPLADGEKLYVPAQGEAALLPTEPFPIAVSDRSTSLKDGQRIDINTASPEELQTLPGIGPVTAQAIVAHRQAHGPFTAIERIVDVKGIGEGTLAKIRDLITVGENKMPPG